MSDFHVTHDRVTASYHGSWKDHEFSMMLDKSSIQTYGATLEEATGKFRRAVLPPNTDRLRGLFTALSNVFTTDVRPDSFSVWDKDFPGGSMSVHVTVSNNSRMIVKINWDYGVKPDRTYDLLVLPGGDKRETFMQEAEKAIAKYREAVLLWKGWMEESICIVTSSLENLLAGGRETGCDPKTAEEK